MSVEATRVRAISLPAWVWTGLSGSVLLAIGGETVGPRPFPTIRLLPIWGGYVVAFLGLALLVSSWLRAGWELHHTTEVPRRVITSAAVLWSGPLLVAPPLFSRDMYSYVAQGRLAAVGLDPYRYAPDALMSSKFVRGVSSVWMHTHAPYGPLFTGFCKFIGESTTSPTMALFAMRALAVGGVVLLATFVPPLARAHGIRPDAALWITVLNPLTVIHLVGGAHNDALMLGLMIAGLALAAERRWVLAIVVCAAAAAIKVPAALAIVYVTCEWLVSLPGRARVRAVATAAGVTAAVFLGVNAVTGSSWGWVAALGTPGKVRTMLSPVTAIGLAAGAVVGRLGTAFDRGAVLGATRALGVVVAAGGVALLVVLRRRIGPYRSLGAALGLVVVLGPVVQPWYLLWAIVVLGAVGSGRWLAGVVWASATLPFLVLPNGSVLGDPLLVAYLAASIVFVAMLAAPRRDAIRLPGGS